MTPDELLTRVLLAEIYQIPPPPWLQSGGKWHICGGPKLVAPQTWILNPRLTLKLHSDPCTNKVLDSPPVDLQELNAQKLMYIYRNKQLRAHLISEANEMKNGEASSLSQLIEDTAPVCTSFATYPHSPSSRHTLRASYNALFSSHMS